MNETETPITGRILIADDNPPNRELLDAYLSPEGHEIEMAADGEETLRKVREWDPDLVLLDIMMPRLSGYEVCQQLKQDAQTRNIPVLMVTALKDVGDIEKAVAAGADDFLTKPVHRLELQTRVRSLLRVRHLTNERDRLLAYLEEVERSIKRSSPPTAEGLCVMVVPVTHIARLRFRSTTGGPAKPQASVAV
jgi:CheY-like chemotaxis protein